MNTLAGEGRVSYGELTPSAPNGADGVSTGAHPAELTGEAPVALRAEALDDEAPNPGDEVDDAAEAILRELN